MVELFIENVKADLSKDIAADITYSLADIRTPEKRQVNYSKTIQLEGTITNNAIFGNIYNIDVENGDNDPALANVGVNFTPKKFAKAFLLSGGIQIFDGTIRLWKIVDKNGMITYETSLYGKLFDLFSNIGDFKLSDLDFSSFDHAYTWDNIRLTWDAAYTGGFVYPLVDYGYNVQDTDGKPSTMRFGSLVPTIFYKIYIDKIFTAAGGKYYLGFSDRTIFDKLVVTAGTGVILGRPNLLDLERLGSTVSDWYECTSGAPHHSHLYENLALFNTVIKNTILTITDSSGFGHPEKVLTFDQDITTSIQVHLDMESTVFPGHINQEIKVMHYHVSDGSSDEIGSYLFDVFGISGGTVRRQTNIEVPKTAFLTGDKLNITCKVFGSFYPTKIRFYDGCTIKAISPNDPEDQPLIEGEIYQMNKSVPKEFKQVDFIKDFIKLFNLYVTQDPDDATIFNFYPYPDFYKTDKTNVIDWTNKIDHSQDITYTPIGMLTAKSYVLTWKQDKDYWCALYFDQNKEVYGQVTYIADTDVITNTEKIELAFSPALMVRYSGGSKVISPAIYKVDNDAGVLTKKPDKFNPRLLIWGGLFDAGHDIFLLNSDITLNDTITQYPYAGHLDNPEAPAYDLNFGNTNTNLPTASENTFSKYWGASIRNAMHKDGKLVACTMLIKDSDIEKLDFAGLYKVDDQFFRLNKISGFNPFEVATSKVELIKVIIL